MKEILDNWLIDGGCGFIGTSLIDRLLRSTPGINIRVFDNLSVGRRESLAEVCNFREIKPGNLKGAPKGVELVVGDIRNFSDCMRVCAGIQIVVHLAASTGIPPSVENPRQDMECNVNGTVNMLEASRLNKVGKFLFASSGAPMGEAKPPLHERKLPKPVSPYGASKLAGEAYCSAYFRTYGLKTVVLRFGNVYGTRSSHKNSVVAMFFKLALNNEPLEIFGSGDQTRDFIFIDDLLQALMSSVKADVGGEIFQIASHKETTVNDIADRIKTLVEKETGRKVKIIHSQPRLGDVKRNYSDISKAKKILGYEPKIDLDTGLKLTFAYFKSKMSVV